MIEQEELRRLTQLREDAAVAERSSSEYRTNLMIRLDAGATVEPGPLSVRIEDGVRHRWTEDVLIKHLGKQVVARLKCQIGRTEFRRLLVFAVRSSTED